MITKDEAIRYCNELMRFAEDLEFLFNERITPSISLLEFGQFLEYSRLLLDYFTATNDEGMERLLKRASTIPIHALYYFGQQFEPYNSNSLADIGYNLRQIRKVAEALNLINKTDVYNTDSVITQIEFDNPLPPVIVPTPPTKGRPKGRQTKPLYDNLTGNDKERQKTLNILRNLITGKKGKEVALIIIGCIRAGKMTKPTFRQLKNEFGEIGHESGYNRYFRDAQFEFTENEIEGISKLF